MRLRSVAVIAASIVLPLGVVLYAFYGSGRQLGGAFFLGLATFALVLLALAVVDAASGLVAEAGPKIETGPVTGRWRKVLNREKQLVVKAIKELEFDHQMGKISAADFAEIGALYRTRAVRVLRQLDESGGDYRVLVEREIKRRHGGSSPTTAVEAEPPTPTTRPTCDSCGTSNDVDAQFCKKCGRGIAASSAS